jgi:branched-chain amino acid transport system permease protein
MARAAGAAAGIAALLAVLSQVLPNGLTIGVVVQGVVFGMLIAMTACGIIVAYRAFKVINFAQAEIGGLASTVAVLTVTGAGFNYFAGVGLGLVAAALTGLAVDLAIMRRFARAPRLNVTVATIGLAQVLGAAELALPSLFGSLKPLSSYGVPWHVSFTISGISFDGNWVLAMAVTPLVYLALAGFLFKTRFGSAIRAVADSREGAAAAGIPVASLGTLTWVVIALLSGIGSLLTTPIEGQNIGAVAGPEALLLPLAAAVVARMESLGLGLVASLALGLFQEIVRWNTSNASIVDLGVFVAIVAGLAISYWGRRGRVEPEQAEYSDVRYPKPIPTPMQLLAEVKVGRPLLVVTVAAAALFVPLSFTRAGLSLASFIVIYVLISASLVVVSGWAGQVSLGQFAFVGIGASIAGVMVADASANLVWAMLASLAAGGLIALLLGLPALRLPGFLLGAATLGFAVPVSTWLLNADNFPGLTPTVVPRPVFLGRFDLSSERTFYVFCAVVALLVLLGLRNLAAGRWGRAVAAVRENPEAAASYGIPPYAVKLGAFAFSGALAGLAGALYVVASRGMQFGGFSPEESLVVFTMAVFGGLGSLAGAVIGAAYVESILYYVSGAWQLFATGAGLLIVLLAMPEGLGWLFYRARDATLGLVRRARGLSLEEMYQRLYALVPHVSPGRDPAADAAVKMGALEELEGQAESSVKALAESEPVLSCEGLVVKRGPVAVLSGVSLEVGRSEVVAIVGTNGAGKTTLLKALAGLVSPASGRVRLGSDDITSWSPQRRFRSGVALVQGPLKLFRSLTVLENLELAAWRQGAAEFREGLARVLELFPILRERAHVPVWNLSGGERQMLALSMGLMGRPRVLLIDELSMGLAPKVVAEIVAKLRQLAEEGMSILLVEQSINVATAIASRAVFLERGKIRFSGRTGDLSRMPELLRSVFLRAAARAVVREREPTLPLSGHGNVMALQAEGLTKYYGAVPALEAVDVSIGLSEVVGIIGANGAGKTTLVDVLSGYAAPDAGRVLMKGRLVTRLSPAQRAELGLGRVFQLPVLFPSMTVRDAVTLALEQRGSIADPLAYMIGTYDVRKQRREILESTLELLAEYGLIRWLDHYVMELSTGTRRILEILCALAREPTVLLMDEPSTGIAQRESEALGELLIALNETRGVSMLIIEHDVPLVARVARRLLCLHLGKVIAEGPVRQVLDNELVVEAYLGREEVVIQRSGAATR